MSDTTKKSAPLSVRLTKGERDALLIRAGGQTLSAFVKQVLFDGPQPLPRGSGIAVADRTLLAHLLATLGGSRIAPNLDRLAHDAELGVLAEDDAAVGRLLQACDDVRLMHNALMRALGMKEKAPSGHELVSGAFNRSAKPEGRE